MKNVDFPELGFPTMPVIIKSKAFRRYIKLPETFIILVLNILIMLEQRRVTRLRIKVKDVYNLNDLVKNMEEWLKENDYVDDEGNQEYETLYTHALRSGGTFLDAWLWWRAVKYPRGTTEKTAFVRYRLQIDMHFLGDAGQVEVMSKGKKVKMNKGEMEITITPILEFDFRNEWKKDTFLGSIETLFKHRLYRKELTNHQTLFLRETYRFHDMLKQFFKLESTAHPETVSQPPKGLM